MSDYSKVREQLGKGVPADVLCATCPWDRLCVTPPTMTDAEVQAQLKDAQQRDQQRDPGRKSMPVDTLMTVVAFAGRDTAGQLCPVFALRLRGPDGRQVADGVRALMRDSVGGGS